MPDQDESMGAAEEATSGDNVDNDLPKERQRSVYEQRIVHINRVVEQIDKERVVIASQLEPILGPKPGIDPSNDKEGKPGDYIPSPLESQLNGTAKRVAELLTEIRVLQKRIVM